MSSSRSCSESDCTAAPLTDAGPGDAQPLLGAAVPGLGHVEQLPQAEHLVVGVLDQQRRGVPGLELARLRALELGPRAAQLGQLAARP